MTTNARDEPSFWLLLVLMGELVELEEEPEVVLLAVAVDRVDDAVVVELLKLVAVLLALDELAEVVVMVMVADNEVDEADTLVMDETEVVPVVEAAEAVEATPVPTKENWGE